MREGGSYVKKPDGSLELVERTGMAPKAEVKPEAAPAPKGRKKE